MNLLKVDSIEEIRQKLLDISRNFQLKPETARLGDANGRILARDIYAHVNVPDFRRSTVDGYAVLSSDTSGASEGIPTFLKMVGTVKMGKPADFSITNGQCAYVPTGGMLPDGADAMVMVEYCENFDEQIVVYNPAAYGSGVVQIGEDTKKDSLLLTKGTILRPQEIGALAALGLDSVEVAPCLSLSIISTGDELVEVGKDINFGEVYDINTYTIASLAKSNGFSIKDTLLVRDNKQKLSDTIENAMKSSDVVVVSGGSSKGEADYTAKIIDNLASSGVLTHGVSIKPGKPTILGYDKPSNTILVGLPGHPVSAMIVFDVLLVWLYSQLTGKEQSLPITATMTTNFASAPGRTTYQLVEIEHNGHDYFATPILGKSGLITTLTRSNGYVIIPVNKEGLVKGERVLVHLI